AAGRAGDLRAAAGSGGQHPGPAADLGLGRGRRGHRRRRRRRGVRGEAAMTEERQVPEAEFGSYYGRPVLKVTRWKEPHLPAYLFLGELSGAAAVLGAVAAASGRPALARAGRLISAAAAAGGAGFLTAELGRPE